MLKEIATPSSILLAGEVMKLVFSWYIIVRRPHEGTAAKAGIGQLKVRLSAFLVFFLSLSLPQSG